MGPGPTHIEFKKNSTKKKFGKDKWYKVIIKSNPTKLCLTIKKINPFLLPPQKVVNNIMK